MTNLNKNININKVNLGFNSSTVGFSSILASSVNFLGYENKRYFSSSSLPIIEIDSTTENIVFENGRAVLLLPPIDKNYMNKSKNSFNIDKVFLNEFKKVFKNLEKTDGYYIFEIYLYIQNYNAIRDFYTLRWDKKALVIIQGNYGYYVMWYRIFSYDNPKLFYDQGCLFLKDIIRDLRFTDPEFNIIYSNQVMLSIFKYSDKEVNGMDLLDENKLKSQYELISFFDSTFSRKKSSKPIKVNNYNIQKRFYSSSVHQYLIKNMYSVNSLKNIHKIIHKNKSNI